MFGFGQSQPRRVIAAFRQYLLQAILRGKRRHRRGSDRRLGQLRFAWQGLLRDELVVAWQAGFTRKRLLGRGLLSCLAWGTLV